MNSAKQQDTNINIQKSIAFLYANNKLTEREIKKTISFIIATKRIKYLVVNLTKDVKNVYLKNYKTLKKEIEEDTNKWKHIPCSWVGRINIIKISILPKAIFIFNVISVKTPMMYPQNQTKYFKKLNGISKDPEQQQPPEKKEHRWMNHTT